MRLSLASQLCALALTTTIAGAASAAVPSAANSTLPTCMALCPLGDMTFTVVVRDLANNPVIGSTVALDFSQCPGASFCEWWPTDPYVLNVPARTILATTDATGTVQLPARVGGTGASGSVRVYADGVFLRDYALASPDQDGNGLVLEGSPFGADATLFAAKLGTSDPTADFDCDGDVDEDDQNLHWAHFSQTCFGYVDAARRSTWGRLKSYYR